MRPSIELEYVISKTLGIDARKVISRFVDIDNYDFSTLNAEAKTWTDNSFLELTDKENIAQSLGLYDLVDFVEECRVN